VAHKRSLTVWDLGSSIRELVTIVLSDAEKVEGNMRFRRCGLFVFRCKLGGESRLAIRDVGHRALVLSC
jgi:hypothetical protein